MIVDKNPHYIILKSLYDLYRNNSDNKKIIEEVSAIAFALHFKLQLDEDAFFDLYELASYPAEQNGDMNSEYIENIEKRLKEIKY